MMGKLLIPIILQLVGVAVIIAEFVVPTAGVLATISIIIFGYSLYYVFSHVTAAAGFAFLVIDLFTIPVLVIIGIRMLAASKVTLNDSLSKIDGAVSEPPEWSAVIGKSGKAVTPLRPAGSAIIDNRKFDVVSKGEFIDKGKEIIVVSVDGNRIVVKVKEPAGAA